MRIGRRYSVSRQRALPEIRFGAWSLRSSSTSIEGIIDDEALNILPRISAKELLDVLKSTDDQENLRRAIWTASNIGTEEHFRVIEGRLQNEFVRRAEETTDSEPPAWSCAAVEVLADQGDAESVRSLLRLTEGSQPLSRLAALSLARQRVNGVQAALRRMVSLSFAGAVEQQRAAALLYTAFQSASGLNELKEELWSINEAPFVRGFGAFAMVPSTQRDATVVKIIIEALRKQEQPNHLVSLMHLADGVADPGREIVSALTLYVSDRRKAREILGEGRSGRVGDFAIFYLARSLSRTEGDRASASPPFPRSVFSRRKLRKNVIRALKVEWDSR